MIPTPNECCALLQAYKVPEHIIRHSRVVHRVALHLCQELNQQGEKLDQAEVEAGSLLHDIAKMEGLHTGEKHSQAGAILLGRLGYPEVAEIVRQHVVLDDGTPKIRSPKRRWYIMPINAFNTLQWYPWRNVSRTSRNDTEKTLQPFPG